MQQDKINGQTVEVCVIAEDGSELAEALTATERGLLDRMDAALRADPAFRAEYQDAALVRVDSNRGLGDGDFGRFYLRYRHQGGMAEFWGNVGDAVSVDVENGAVCVEG